MTNEDKKSEDNTKVDGEQNLKGIEDEGDCGWASIRPGFIQKFNNPAGYLCVFSLFLVTQGLLVNGYANVVLSTLERRFRLQSFQAGLIVVSYDIGYFILCLFVTFYGNKGHRPRMLAISSVIFGVGTLVFSIPHFTTGLYEYGENFSELCDSAHKPPACGSSTTEEDQLDDYFYLFMFAMLLQGFGCICLYTLGFTVLEDSLSKEKSALYVGIANAITIVGPCLGFAIGGVSLTFYVDLDVLDPEDVPLETSDPRWVGAWWIGYLLATGMAWLLVSIPMFGFPKQFPGSAVVRSMKESEVHVGASEDIVEKEGFGDSMKDLPKAMYLMLRNAPFLFTTFAGCSEGFIVAAFTAFLPKYLQTQFSLTTAEAGLYAGVIAIPGGIVGMLLSPIIINRLKLRTPGIIKMCIICCLVVLAMVPVCLLHCPTPDVAGATVPYQGASSIGNLSTSCNSQCECQGEYFSPVCGTDNLTYFSACFAGCSTEADNGNYEGCLCITNSTPVAVPGLCVESCNVLAPFLACFFVVVMVNFMTTTPVLLIVMRCVPQSQKSFAIGVQWFIVRALGSIPGPIVFGVVFDATCKLWQESECSGEQGSCWIHDSRDVATWILTASVVCKTLSAILFSLSLYLYKPPAKDDDTSQELQFEEFSVSDKYDDVNHLDTKRPHTPQNDDVITQL